MEGGAAKTLPLSSLTPMRLSTPQAYGDVRRGHLDTVLHALQAPVPLGAGPGEGEVGVTAGGGGPANMSSWVERYDDGEP